MRTLQTLIVITLLSSVIAMHPSLAADQQSMPPASDQASKPTVEKGVREDVKETIDAIKSYSMEKKDEAVKKSKEALDDFNARMDKLEQQIKEKKSEWSEKFAKEKEEELVELKKARTEMTERYEILKKASKMAWEAAKEAFINSYRELEHKFDKLKSGTAESKEEKHDTTSQQPASKP